MGVVALFLVEHPRAQAVERFQIGLDAGGLVGLLPGVFPNKELRLARCTLVAQQGLEHLLIKRVLQLIVFNVPIHVGSARHILVQLKVPAYELGVGLTRQEAFYDIVNTLILSYQPQGLGGAALLLAVGIGGVSVANQKAELLQWRHLTER